MPIQLRHQTQRQNLPSAASHGVGLPVSDGGLGAVSQALGQVAGAAGNIGARLQQKDDIVQRESYNLAGDRVAQEMDADESALALAKEQNNSAEYGRLLQAYQEKWVNNDIDPNTGYIKTEDGESLLRDSGVRKFSEATKTLAAQRYKELNISYLSLQSDNITRKQVTKPREAVSAVVSKSTTEYVPYADVQSVISLGVKGWNHESIAGYEEGSRLRNGVREELKSQLINTVDAVIGSVKFSDDPMQMLQDMEDTRRLLTTEEVQEAYGADVVLAESKKLGKVINDMSSPAAYDAKPLLNTLSPVVEALTTEITPSTFSTTQNTTPVLRKINGALVYVEKGSSDHRSLISSKSLIETRQAFDYNHEEVRKGVYEFYQENPEASPSSIFLTGILDPLGLDVSDLKESHQSALGEYFQNFSNKVKETETEFGAYEARRLLGDSKLTQESEEADALLRKLVQDSPSDTQESGSDVFTDISIARMKYAAEGNEYPGIPVLVDMLSKDMSEQKVAAAVDLIQRVWGPKRVSSFIADHSDIGSSKHPHGKELAMQIMVNTLTPRGSEVSATKWTSLGADPESNLNGVQQSLYNDTLKYRVGVATGDFDTYGNKIDSDSFVGAWFRAEPSLIDKLIQGHSSEFDTNGAAMWSQIYKGAVVEAIQNKTPEDRPDPRKIHREVEDKLNSMYSVIDMPNGTSTVSGKEFQSVDYTALDSSEVGGVMWDTAFRYAERAGIDIVRDLRNQYAVQPEDDQETVDFKNQMNKWEGDEEFLEKIQKEQVVRPDGTYGPIARLGMAGPDEQGNVVRSLLLYNPNSKRFEAVTLQTGEVFKLSDRALHYSVSSLQSLKVNNPRWYEHITRIKGNLRDVVRDRPEFLETLKTDPRYQNPTK